MPKLIHFLLKNSPLFLLSLSFFLLLGQCLKQPIFAQSLSTGVAVYVDIPGQNIQPGSIISLSSHNYHLSTVPYDPTVVGVVVKDPSVALENPNSIATASYPIVHEGKAYVLVNTANGNIQAGNLLTTSKATGIAQKATEDGYIIGTALQSYDNTDKKKSGLILANLTFINQTSGVAPNTENVFSSFQKAINTGTISPATIIRYVAAVIVLLFSFILGIGYFGRIATTGIEALGRNPLASKLIWTGIGFNIAIMLILIIIGIAISYFILVI